MLPNTLPAQSNDHSHLRGSCYPTVSPKIHAQGDGLEFCFPALELTYSLHTFCTSHLKIVVVFVWDWISAQSDFISNYFLLEDLRNEPNFSVSVQMQVWEPHSGTHTWFLVQGFFFPSGLSDAYLKKMCYVGQSIFWHAWKSVLLISVHFLVVIHQNADSGEGSVLKATFHLPSISKLVCIMTTPFPPTCQY